MKMYYKGSKQPVDVHETRVEWMKSQGWTEKQTKSDKPKKEDVKHG